MAWEASCLRSPILLVLLASGSWAQGTESLIHAVKGRKLLVKCQYDPSQCFKEKIWCQKTPADTCNILVSSFPGRDAQGGQYFISDNPDSNFFTVIMTMLKITDSGFYHCGILESSRIVTVLRSFHLVVSKDNSNTPASGMTSTWTGTEVSTFNPTEDLNAISARGAGRGTQRRGTQRRASPPSVLLHLHPVPLPATAGKEPHGQEVHTLTAAVPRALRNPCRLHRSLLESSNPAQATSPKMGGLSPSSQGPQELLPDL